MPCETKPYSLLLTLSSARIPTKAISRMFCFPTISLRHNNCGVVLCTLQHHLNADEGGPNTVQLVCGLTFDRAIKNRISLSSHDFFVISITLRVSGNSIPVSPKITTKSL